MVDLKSNNLLFSIGENGIVVLKSISLKTSSLVFRGNKPLEYQQKYNLQSFGIFHPSFYYLARRMSLHSIILFRTFLQISISTSLSITEVKETIFIEVPGYASSLKYMFFLRSC